MRHIHPAHTPHTHVHIHTPGACWIYGSDPGHISSTCSVSLWGLDLIPSTPSQFNDSVPFPFPFDQTHSMMPMPFFLLPILFISTIVQHVSFFPRAARSFAFLFFGLRMSFFAMNFCASSLSRNAGMVYAFLCDLVRGSIHRCPFFVELNPA